MNKKIGLILAAMLVCILVLGGSSLAFGQAANPPGAPTLQGGHYRLQNAAPAQAPRPASVLASGGKYRLESAAAGAPVLASGGRYQLSAPAAPAAVGKGCCCTYLPCLSKIH